MLVPLVLLAVYFANGAHFQGNDTLGSPATALSLVRDGDFDITELVARSRPSYWFQRIGERFVSTYGFGCPVVAFPVFELLDALVFRHRWSFERMLLAGKVVGAVTTAASATLLLVVARRFAGLGGGLAVAALYGLASPSWSVVSQGLWQHGPAALCVTAGLALALWPKDAHVATWRPALAGLPIGLAVWCRESLVLLVPALALYLFATRRRAVLPFLALAGVLGVGLMALNHHYLGSPFASAHRLWVEGRSAREGFGLWDTSIATGVYGLLASPSRGLFVYCPVFLVAALGAFMGLRGRREREAWALLLAGAVLAVASVVKWHWWWGGDTYGPRLCADATPFLALLLLPVWPRLDPRSPLRSRALQATSAVLFAFSVYVQGIGAFLYDGVSWDERTPEEAIDTHPERLFSWSDSQLGFYLRLPATEPQRIPFR